MSLASQSLSRYVISEEKQLRIAAEAQSPWWAWQKMKVIHRRVGLEFASEQEMLRHMFRKGLKAVEDRCRARLTLLMPGHPGLPAHDEVALCNVFTFSPNALLVFDPEDGSYAMGISPEITGVTSSLVMSALFACRADSDQEYDARVVKVWQLAEALVRRYLYCEVPSLRELTLHGELNSLDPGILRLGMLYQNTAEECVLAHEVEHIVLRNTPRHSLPPIQLAEVDAGNQTIPEKHLNEFRADTGAYLGVSTLLPPPDDVPLEWVAILRAYAPVLFFKVWHLLSAISDQSTLVLPKDLNVVSPPSSHPPSDVRARALMSHGRLASDSHPVAQALHSVDQLLDRMMCQRLDLKVTEGHPFTVARNPDAKHFSWSQFAGQ